MIFTAVAAFVEIYNKSVLMIALTLLAILKQGGCCMRFQTAIIDRGGGHGRKVK